MDLGEAHLVRVATTDHDADYERDVSEGTGILYVLLEEQEVPLRPNRSKDDFATFVPPTYRIGSFRSRARMKNPITDYCYSTSRSISVTRIPLAPAFLTSVIVSKTSRSSTTT